MNAISKKFPLHLAQQEVYFDQMEEVSSPHYNVGGYVRLKGKLNPAVFIEALQSLSAVYDVFQFRLDLSGDEPMGLYLEQTTEVIVGEMDYTDREQPRAAAIAWMGEQFNQAFDIENNNFYEFYLIKISEEEYLWYQRFHHLVTDGFGFVNYIKYVVNKYAVLMNADLA
ncbi:MAG: condensation domain-containing protein, partial [Bacteroidota bacterium]